MRTSKTLLLQSLKIKKKEPSATQRKKSTKLSSKTTAKLSTSAKRIQKELAEITLNPPPNCRLKSEALLFGDDPSDPVNYRKP
ncbi:Hypothetical predicted protein, partial [Marmota monax]